MKRLALLLLVAVGLALGAPAASQAAFGLSGAEVEFFDQDGSTAESAGSHPFTMTTTTAFNTVVAPDGGELPDQQLRQLVAELPVGMIGDPQATPRCSSADFANISNDTLLPACTNETVVGMVGVSGRLDKPVPGQGVPEQGFLPVYNLEPGPGEVAKLGFAFLKVPVVITIHLDERSPQENRPYRVIAEVKNVSQVLHLFSTELILWGDPTHSEHDPFRGSCLDQTAPVTGEPISKGNCPVDQEDARPFLTMPRSCQGSLDTDLSVSSWEAPDLVVPFEVGSPGMTDCKALGFSPEVSLSPGGSQADSPSGLAFDLAIDDPGLTSLDPDARAHSDIKKAVVTLPPGVTVNPALAGGLEVCSAAQIAAETASSDFGAGCPSASRIGSVVVETPLLDRSLTGSVFAAKQIDNPFGSLLALYIVIKSRELGVSVSLAGRVDPHPHTGQIVSTFDDLPQFPFESFRLQFREGPRAPLIMPPTCGSYAITTELTPWANPDAPLTRTSTFQVTHGPGGSACPSGTAFAPRLSAGTTNPLAGASSPFALRLTREDGTQRLAGVDLTLPAGLVGKLAGIPYCGDGVLAGIAAANQPGQGALQIATPSCPGASLVGTATVGSGAGPNPVYVDSGRVYLAGPYRGAPLSLAIVTPAVAGPFDLGNVVVRTALHVDQTTAQVRAISDPLPTILHGIPLDLRDIQIRMDRPDFILNPTSCDESSFNGAALSVGGLAAPIADRFQVGSCERLPFKPQLSLRFKGKTKRDGHPQTTAVLRPRPGSANIRRAVVILPHSQFIDQDRIGNPCTRAQFSANACPRKSLLGRAEAVTPLLDQPLKGPVYFRSNGGERDLPDIVADLRGQINIVLVGYVDSVTRRGSERSRIRTIFARVPDAPVSRFVMRFFGGDKGLLVNSVNLCKTPRRATVKMTAQSGKVHDSDPLIKTPCKRKKKAGRR